MKRKIFYRIDLAIFLCFCLTKVSAQITPLSNDIGVDISTMPQNTSFNYDSCFALGANLGMSRVGMFQAWTGIETAPMTYNMFLMDIANVYYPAHGMAIDLTIAPIATNNLEVPSDLTSTAFDSPTMINRFKRLLDSIKVHTPSLTLSSLVIGSEHDVYLGSNATMWSQYTTFYNSVSAYAKTLWPGLKVATELTFGGITTNNALCQTLNANSDYIGVSYYPLNNDFTVKPVSTIPTDFATLVSLYPSKPLCFYQYGYPSSVTCNSSEMLQSNFITQTFTTWDTYASNVKMIDFTWLHDLDTATVNYYGTYYGITDAVFLEYLHTLGLRMWNGNGTDKAAFVELECQAKQRGYNSLPISCLVTEIGERESKSILSIFPNPAKEYVNISVPAEFKNSEIKIYNEAGQLVKHTSVSEENVSIRISDLPNGLYFLLLENTSAQLKEKFTIIK